MTELFSEPVGGSLFPFASLVKRVLLLQRTRRLQTARLVGPDGEALYAGEGENLDWLAHLHHARIEERRPIGLVGLRQLAEDRRMLLYVEVNRLLRSFLPSGAFYTLPWIRFVADLDPGKNGSSEKLVEATYGRKVRQQGFISRFTSTPEAAREFHHEFYLPYIRWRFSDRAHPRSHSEIAAVVRGGFILHILDNEMPVAAAACRVRGKAVTLVASGLRGSYPDLLRRGAMSALYYELFRWARANGLAHVDLLRSRPHADDGVSLHKKRFGARPEQDAWPHALLAVYPPADSPLPAPARDLFVESANRELAKLGDLAEAATHGGD